MQVERQFIPSLHYGIERNRARIGIPLADPLAVDAHDQRRARIVGDDERVLLRGWRALRRSEGRYYASQLARAFARGAHGLFGLGCLLLHDLLVALIFLGSNPTIAPFTLTLAQLVGSYGENYPVLTAAAFLAMALPLVVFFSMQRYFVRGILAGSVKG